MGRLTRRFNKTKKLQQFSTHNKLLNPKPIRNKLESKFQIFKIKKTLNNREYAELARDFLDLGLLPPGADVAAVEPALTGVFQKALAGGVANLSFGGLSGARKFDLVLCSIIMLRV